MLHEVDEERLPVVLERRRTGIGLDLQLLAVLRLAIDEVLPRHHRVAGDVGSDAAALAEGDILVEDGVVERPGAVRLADVADHRVVAVEALVVPGKLRQRRRQHLLSAVRERGPEGTHRVIVRLRERLHVLPARDGPRMLPEVEEVLPLLRRRQDAVDDGELHLVAARLERHGAGLRARRHLHLDDDEPRTPGGKRRLLRVPFDAVTRRDELAAVRLTLELDWTRQTDLTDEAGGQSLQLRLKADLGLLNRRLELEGERLALPRRDLVRPGRHPGRHQRDRHHYRHFVHRRLTPCSLCVFKHSYRASSRRSEVPTGRREGSSPRRNSQVVFRIGADTVRRNQISNLKSQIGVSRGLISDGFFAGPDFRWVSRGR